ncbi:MAG TPA: hypothetical protein HPP51_01380 [Planctomycetes bacterium]|nr:hypothetical protein [Planctomycetota bacterium]
MSKIMADKNTAKSNGLPKSFMTVGPTLHYSHANVRRCWALAVVVYVAACLFWSKILTGIFLSLSFGDQDLTGTEAWRLGRFIVSPLSIYEYPWQILILGLLMGILAVGPVLVSQLLSFRYSLPMILAVAFIARLPLFGVFLLVSCTAVACRPLRFRSRFIAIALCITPQLVYWALFGGARSVDPIRLGFSFAPWICAWLTALAIAGMVIGIGHFTRYRPGLIWVVTALVLGITVCEFQWKISFAELDYQLYIAGNNPEEVVQFHDHNMTEAIDKAIKKPGTQSFLTGLFYPTEPILLREQLKQEIQIQLGYDRWPNWFEPTEELNFQAKRQQLLGQYNLFINKRPTSKRMPIALYYKAMLNEYSPNIRQFAHTEVLSFYSDHPHRETLPIWYKLYDEFPQSSEALEARWRIAMHLAGQGKFEKASELCELTEAMLSEHLELLEQNQPVGGKFSSAFAPPATTAMTPFKLKDLQRKLQKLIELVNGQNLNESEQSKKALAEFILLNPYSLDYPKQLNRLIAETDEKSPLRDNVLLAKIMLIPDAQLKVEKLKELGEKFANTDGGTQALYELGLLKVALWKDPQTEPGRKETYLADARAILTNFIALYPKSIYSIHAQTMLDSLPAVE